MSAPSLHELAAAALAALAGTGESGGAGEAKRWHAALAPPGGEALDLLCTGPDLPAAIPAAVASAETVLRQRPWQGRYRLVVRAARLIVLDLAWNRADAVRILGFSRGDWERALLALAAERRS